MGAAELLSGEIWARLREPEPKARTVIVIVIAIAIAGAIVFWSLVREINLVICHLQLA